MRILRISGGLDPKFGGPANSTARAAAADSRAGHQVVLAFAGLPRAHEAATPLLDWLTSEGVELRSFPTMPALETVGHRFAASPRMVGWLHSATRAADVVHLHGAWPITSLAGLFSARSRQTPTVLTPHESLTNVDVATSRSPTRAMTKRALRKVWLRGSSMVVFSSLLELQESLQGHGDTNAEVVPHPVVDERQPARLAVRAADPVRDELRLGFLGRFHEKKNLPVLLEAMSVLPEQVKLVVSGGGYGSEEVLRDLAARLGVSHRITWMGFSHHEERDRFWDGIDVLVLPSRFECFGMVVAEAMERGVPTIVANRVGAADLVRRHGAGVVIEPSVEGIRDAALGYLRDVDRRIACSAAGRRGALADLTLERYGDAMTHIYRTLGERVA